MPDDGIIVVYEQMGLVAFSGYLCACPARTHLLYLMFGVDLTLILNSRAQLGLLTFRFPTAYSAPLLVFLSESGDELFSIALAHHLPKRKRTLLQALAMTQRRVRAWLWRRVVARRLAIAMALHPRLGSTSTLTTLHEDTIACIAAHV